jgi:AraC-like DNA-binding protein
VEEFNIDKGLYIFEFNGLETGFHSHPTIEIIMAKNGDFTLLTGEGTYANLKFALIRANQKHRLISKNGVLRTIMIEHHGTLVMDKMKLVGVEPNKEFCSELKVDRHAAQIERMVRTIKSGHSLAEYDPRISDVIDHLKENDLAYSSMMKKLKGITHLSESRLSHLFKSNVGISLKKYLVWSRLKSTIKQHLDAKEDIFSALANSGFYDQPHFSKNFKSMLGVRPSKVYNSRTLQV